MTLYQKIFGLFVLFNLAACSDGGQDIEGESLLPTTRAAADKPNILIILSDDLGINEVGSYGNPVIRTPHIDKLAQEGLKFNQAFVPASMCSPSRAALYTGLYPRRNGIYRNHAGAYDGIKSIPHFLTKLGYRTSLVGKIHVKPFDVFPFEFLDRDIDDVEDYLNRIGDSPFAMIVAQHHPHVPWVSNKEYDPDVIPLSPKFVDTAETRAAMTRYYSSVTESDTEMGKYLELLDKRGLRDNTIVIYLSDHGAQMPFAKFSNYDASLNVPFIIRWPGVIEQNSQHNALISSVDILPTLIEIAGGIAPESLDGKSFLPTLTDLSAEHHTYVFGTQNTLGLRVENPKAYGIRTVRDKRYRYIKNLNHTNKPVTLMTAPRALTGSVKYFLVYGSWIAPGVPAYWQSWVKKAKTDDVARATVDQYYNRPAEELYDLENDPHELHNIALDPSQQANKERLRSALESWRLQQGDVPE
ncbi:sulfatase [Paremcibacter congregatus]|uniref:sulfatase family protein n=1 Tax=Paremcibacter congregatus TaxID=2043170 RepID=UPI003A8ED1A6